MSFSSCQMIFIGKSPGRRATAQRYVTSGAYKNAPAARRKMPCKRRESTFYFTVIKNPQFMVMSGIAWGWRVAFFNRSPSIIQAMQ